MNEPLTGSQKDQLVAVTGGVLGLTAAVCGLSVEEAQRLIRRFMPTSEARIERDALKRLKHVLTGCLDTIREFEERE